MSKIDWTKIRTEYIAGEGSYRTLAEKYGVCYSVIYRRGKEENWADARREARNKAVSKAVQKNEEKTISALQWLGKAKESLARKLAGAVEAVDETDAQAVRQIVAAVKDAQIVLNDKTKAQIEEQEARISLLRKQAEKEKDDNEPVVVTFDSETEAWAK